MAKKGIILVVIASFSALLLAAQTSSFAPRKLPPRKPGMTDEQHRKEIEKAREQAKQQRSIASEKRIKAMFPPAWKRLLRISDRQWKLIEPKIDKVQTLGWSTWACGAGWGGKEERDFHWYKHSEGTHLRRAKDPHEMSEGEKLADELVDLLRDENSKDEQIRKTIDELQQVRANAQAALAQAKKELAAVLTTPRQEAIFLVLGCID